MALQRPQAHKVRNFASSHKIDYVEQFLETLKLKRYQKGNGLIADHR